METYVFTCCTGGGGNVGGHAARALHRRARESHRPVHVRLAVRNPAKAAQLFEDLGDVDIVEMDFSQPDSYAAALRGAQGVFLGTSETGDFDSKDRLGAFVDAGRDAGSPLVVRILGSGLVEGAELDFRALIEKTGCRLLDGHVLAYDLLGRARAEGRARITFVDVMSWFYQNFVAYYGFLVQEGTLAIPNGDAALPHIDSRDIGEFIAAVMLGGDTYRNQDFLLTGAHRPTGSEWASMISKATGRHIAYEDSASAMRAAYSDIEVAPGVSLWDVMAPMNELERLVNDAKPALRPETFERVTGLRHRSPVEFCNEMSMTSVWNASPS